MFKMLKLFCLFIEQGTLVYENDIIIAFYEKTFWSLKSTVIYFAFTKNSITSKPLVLRKTIIPTPFLFMLRNVSEIHFKLQIYYFGVI